MALLEESIKETRTLKNYIDGEWVESKGEIVDVINTALLTRFQSKPKMKFKLS